MLAMLNGFIREQRAMDLLVYDINDINGHHNRDQQLLVYDVDRDDDELSGGAIRASEVRARLGDTDATHQHVGKATDASETTGAASAWPVHRRRPTEGEDPAVALPQREAASVGVAMNHRANRTRTTNAAPQVPGNGTLPEPAVPTLAEAAAEWLFAVLFRTAVFSVAVPFVLGVL